MEFIATGRVTLAGVEFIIEAETLEEAQDKAQQGQFKESNWSGAELVDWEIRKSTLQENG